MVLKIESDCPSSSSPSSSPPSSSPSSLPPSSPLLAAGNILPSNPYFLSLSSTFFLQSTNTTVTSNKRRSKASPSRPGRRSRSRDCCHFEFKWNSHKIIINYNIILWASSRQEIMELALFSCLLRTIVF
ncbi:hypothetical protein S245_028070 [Arachis hypogaea]